jgi:OmpA-OmpF porin, OOP family
MRSTKNQAVFTAACALALGVFSVTASAQPYEPRPADEKALLIDSRGAPVMSGTGLCWHTNSDPAPQWTGGCHPYVAPVSQYVAPYVAPAPAPRPAPVVVAAAAPAPVYEKVVFDANILFDSDKSALRPLGRTKLDDFVRNISGLESQSMMAVGYADRTGTMTSNQTLSEARVRTVKAYLVSKGVASDRIQTAAFGETRPTTGASECKDSNSAKDVACLQPDRHVFIEVSGVRRVQ